LAISKTSTASPPYDNVVVETLAGEIRAGPHNTNAANLKTAAQSHVHELEGKIGFDSLQADFRPPDTGDSTNRWRLVCGVKAGSITNGEGGATVTFATDADQGDPSFTTAPRTTATVTTVGGGVGSVVVRTMNPITTTAVSFGLTELNGATNSGTVNIHWMAYGKIA
jgi:hypothetical protein